MRRGLTFGNAQHYAAVPVGRDPQPVQTFGSFTADLHRLGQWLRACKIETVVMQATGVYWIALYEVLEGYGFNVYVVNAKHTKTLPGRKTDVCECQWLQKLHTFGLPNNPSCRLRKSVRCAPTCANGRTWWRGPGPAFSRCKKCSPR